MSLFDRDSFERLSLTERQRRAEELATYLTQRVHGADDFEEEISRIVASLREQGHDLWSWDESDDFQIWGPDYTKAHVTGLVLDFRKDLHTDSLEVEVEWQENQDPTIPRRVFGDGL